MAKIERIPYDNRNQIFPNETSLHWVERGKRKMVVFGDDGIKGVAKTEGAYIQHYTTGGKRWKRLMQKNDPRAVTATLGLLR